MDLKKKVLLLIVAILPIFTLASSSALPAYAAVGYPYYITANVGSGTVVPCALSSTDEYNTPVKVWTLDSNGFPLTTNLNGTLNTFVTPDNAFLLNHNYTFQLQCGAFTNSTTVGFLIGGTSVQGNYVENSIFYFMGNPQEGLLAIFLAMVAFGFAIWTKRSFFQGERYS